MEYIYSGIACTDCLHYLANGDVPGETEDLVNEWLANFAKRNDGYDVTLGTTEHDCRDADGRISDDCQCDHYGFSWSSCDTCGSPLGGDRYAVSWFMGESMRKYAETFTEHYSRAMLAAGTRNAEDDPDCDYGSEVNPEDWQTPGDTWGLCAFAPASQMRIMTDCESFVAGRWSDLRALDAAQCGHDFALTRNGCGAGFWDRGLGAVGERLTAACKTYGGSGAWFGADGIVHLDDEEMMVNS